MPSALHMVSSALWRDDHSVTPLGPDTPHNEAARPLDDPLRRLFHTLQAVLSAVQPAQGRPRSAAPRKPPPGDPDRQARRPRRREGHNAQADPRDPSRPSVAQTPDPPAAERQPHAAGRGQGQRARRAKNGRTKVRFAERPGHGQ